MADPVSIFAPSQQSLGPLGKLRAQAEELEGVFLNTLMSQMFSSIETEGEFGGGFAEETWRSMQSEQYAAAMAASGGIGLADQLVSELMKLQEAKGAS
jgi:flagellar protein FlgJ